MVNEQNVVFMIADYRAERAYVERRVRDHIARYGRIDQTSKETLHKEFHNRTSQLAQKHSAAYPMEDIAKAIRRFDPETLKDPFLPQQN